MHKKLYKIVCIPLFLFILVSSTSVIPIVYADTIDTTELTATEYRILYGNGVDDNGDGVIDDENETDVGYGNVDIDTSSTTFDGWITNISYEVGGLWYNFTIENGVKLGGVFERRATVTPSNGSVSGGPYDCYATSSIRESPWDNNSYSRNGSSFTTNDMIPILKYYINLTADEVMNGVQEVWHRSPLYWDTTKFYETTVVDDNGETIHFPRHFINMFDSTGRLVYASPGGQRLNHLVYDNRVYTFINAHLKSDEIYTVYEYVEPKNGDPISSFDMYFCPNQDICNDNLKSTIIFPGTGSSQLIENNYGEKIECSYGLLCTIGIGRVGTEKLIVREPGIITRIHTQSFEGSLNQADQIKIVFPFRTTIPVNISLYLYIYSGGSTDEEFHMLTNVTGTIIHQFNFTDPDNAETNLYRLEFSIQAHSEVSAQYCTYLMIPSNVSHMVENRYGEYEFPCGFSAYVELLNETFTGAPTEADESVTWLDALVGTALILQGVLIDVFSFPVSAITFMVTGTTLGSFFIEAGFNKWGLSISGSDFYGYIVDNAGRLLAGIYEGITWIGNELWDGVLWVAERIGDIAESVLYYGGIIVEVLANIAYFLVFLLFIWGCAYFYRILWAVGHLDPFLIGTIGSELRGQVQSATSKASGVKGKIFSKLRRK